MSNPNHPDHVGTYRHGYIGESYVILYIPDSADMPCTVLMEAPSDEADARMVADLLNLADEGGCHGANMARRALAEAMELEAAVVKPEDDSEGEA